MHIKLGERPLRKCQRDFPAAVCAEVETNNDVAVCNHCQCVAIGIRLDDGLNELIGDACVIRLLDGLANVSCGGAYAIDQQVVSLRSEEHTSELQSLMRISYAVFC